MNRIMEVLEQKGIRQIYISINQVIILRNPIILVLLFLILLSSCKEKENNVIQPLSCKIVNPIENEIILKGDTVRVEIIYGGTETTPTYRNLFIDGESKELSDSPPYYYNWATFDCDTGIHDIYTEYFGQDLNVRPGVTDAINVYIMGGYFPVANFNADVLSGIPPLTVQFTDHSTNSPTNWQWEFGEGGSSSLQHPSHTYLSSGNYTVILTAGNSHGQTTKERINYINPIVQNPCPGTPSIEYHGQVYNTIKIGGQCWLKENLNWNTGESWCYDNNPANCEIYGRLYNWHTIMDGAQGSNTIPSGVQGICPDGWHIPSFDEWDILAQSLGGTSIAGGKMKKAGTDDWKNPNEGATNESGFTALPAGMRDNTYSFQDLKKITGYWSTTEGWTDFAEKWWLYSNCQDFFYIDENKNSGLSVRCLKD